MMRRDPTVYLIHLDQPLGSERHSAQHYIGYADDYSRRMQEHRCGRGAAMLRAANERGITYRLARLWNGQDRRFERRLKNRKNARRLCPICMDLAPF